MAMKGIDSPLDDFFSLSLKYIGGKKYANPRCPANLSNDFLFGVVVLFLNAFNWYLPMWLLEVSLSPLIDLQYLSFYKNQSKLLKRNQSFLV